MPAAHSRAHERGARGARGHRLCGPGLLRRVPAERGRCAGRLRGRARSHDAQGQPGHAGLQRQYGHAPDGRLRQLEDAGAAGQGDKGQLDDQEQAGMVVSEERAL